MKTAIITGITGQDGAYLAELLLNKDYVASICRSALRAAKRIHWRLDVFFNVASENSSKRI
jgi:GDPmannose 4,6-dehydratase